MKLPDFLSSRKEMPPADQSAAKGRESVPGVLEKISGMIGFGRESGKEIKEKVDKEAQKTGDPDSLELQSKVQAVWNEAEAELDKIEQDAARDAERLGSEQPESMRLVSRRKQKRAEKRFKQQSPAHDSLRQESTKPIPSESAAIETPEEKAALDQMEKNLMETPRNVEDYIKEMAKELNGQGACLDEATGQIEMEAFRANEELSADLDADLKYVKDREAGFASNPEAFERKKIGDSMEMFKTAVFSKALGKGFFVCRSSKFDDYHNGIDNIIVDPNGNAAGAFDEAVRSTKKFNNESLEAFNKKKDRIKRRNKKGGGHAKYCLGKDENGRIVKKEQKGIPLFYLDLTYAELMDGIKDFDPDAELSEYQKKVVEKFFSSINKQAEILEEEFGFDLSAFRKSIGNLAAEQGINLRSETGYRVEYGEKAK